MFKSCSTKWLLKLAEPEVDLVKLKSNGPVVQEISRAFIGRFSQPRSEGWKILETLFLFVWVTLNSVGFQIQGETSESPIEVCSNNLLWMPCMKYMLNHFPLRKGILVLLWLGGGEAGQLTVSLQHLRPCFHSVCAACLQCLSSNSEGDAFDCPRCGRRTQKMWLGLGRSAFCLDRDVWAESTTAVGLGLHSLAQAYWFSFLIKDLWDAK